MSKNLAEPSTQRFLAGQSYRISQLERRPGSDTEAVTEFLVMAATQTDPGQNIPTGASGARVRFNDDALSFFRTDLIDATPTFEVFALAGGSPGYYDTFAIIKTGIYMVSWQFSFGTAVAAYRKELQYHWFGTPSWNSYATFERHDDQDETLFNGSAIAIVDPDSEGGYPATEGWISAVHSKGSDLSVNAAQFWITRVGDYPNTV